MQKRHSSVCPQVCDEGPLSAVAVHPSRASQSHAGRRGGGIRGRRRRCRLSGRAAEGEAQDTGSKWVECSYKFYTCVSRLLIQPRQSAPLEILEQNDRLMELILDISNELDIDILCHRILLNVGQLTKADRCSLFLARGPRENRYLEAKLFDVEANTSEYEILMSSNLKNTVVRFYV